MFFYKNRGFEIASAIGKGDYHAVITIEEEALRKDPDNPHSQSMIGFCYEMLGDPGKAKEFYGKALANAPTVCRPIEGLARIYAKEKNHHIAYQYVLKGMDAEREADSPLPKWLRFATAVILKIFKPGTPFDKIRSEVNGVDASRDKWLEWAREYKAWYEKELSGKSTELIH